MADDSNKDSEDRDDAPTEETDDSYDVGRAKPPKHSQYKPGQTGNPKGRPKGRHNLARVLDDALSELIPLLGSKKKMPAIKVLVLNIRNRALKGDPKAVTALLMMMRACGKLDPEPLHALEDSLTDIDEALIADYIRRLGGPELKDGSDDDDADSDSKPKSKRKAKKK